MNLPAGVDVITSPEAGPDKGCSVELSSDSGFFWVRPEVELVCGIRVEPEEGIGVRSVAGDGVGVRVVLGYGFLAGPARRRSPRAGPAEDAGTTRGALTG
jgi:hypothetical protein